MVVTVSLQAVADQLEFVSDEVKTYLDLQTGDFIMLPDDIRREAEEWEEGDQVPYTWIEDTWPQICRIVQEDGGFAVLPSKWDIHEWQIMADFARSRENPREFEDLHIALRGAGAFRHFKDGVHRMRIEKEWYKFRSDALLEIARDWCEEHQIPYKLNG